jgi:hypothetical protein
MLSKRGDRNYGLPKSDQIVLFLDDTDADDSAILEGQYSLHRILTTLFTQYC